MASSQYNQYYGPDRGRLRTEGEGNYGGGWAAQYNDVNQFLQFDFSKVTKLTAVATQGRSDADWMVTSYTLAYSVDGGSFTTYGEGDGQVSNILLLHLLKINTVQWYLWNTPCALLRLKGNIQGTKLAGYQILPFQSLKYKIDPFRLCGKHLSLSFFRYLTATAWTEMKLWAISLTHPSLHALYNFV